MIPTLQPTINKPLAEISRKVITGNAALIIRDDGSYVGYTFEPGMNVWQAIAYGGLMTVAAIKKTFGEKAVKGKTYRESWERQD